MQKNELYREVIQGNNTYIFLLDEIRNGLLRPRDRLVEAEIAKRLGVSRTPVREAIHQLVNEGLVVHLPRQGISIRSLDYDEIMELYEMRIALEGIAAKLAARMTSEAEIEILIEMNKHIAQAKTAQEAHQLNLRFHNIILKAARNRFLIKSIQGLENALCLLGPTTLTKEKRADSALKEHNEIIQALEQRNGEAAEKLMRTHIEAGQKERIRALSNANSVNHLETVPTG